MPDADSSSTHESDLVELLERRVRLCEHLAALTRQHGALLAGGQVEPAMAMLHRRGRVIEQLAALGAQLAMTPQRWDQRRAAMTPDARGHVDRLVERSDQLLREVLDADAQAGRGLDEARRAACAELGRIRQLHAARRAYNGPNSGSVNRFTNQQG